MALRGGLHVAVRTKVRSGGCGLCTALIFYQFRLDAVEHVRSAFNIFFVLFRGYFLL